MVNTIFKTEHPAGWGSARRVVGQSQDRATRIFEELGAVGAWNEGVGLAPGAEVSAPTTDSGSQGHAACARVGTGSASKADTTVPTI